jgi:hypothetical protein
VKTGGEKRPQKALKMQPKATQSIENAAPPKGPPKMMKND